MIQACLNGSRVKGSHPALPLTPEQIARAALECAQAGAQSLHVHPRNADGEQVLNGEVIGASVKALRGAVPNLPIGVSTLASMAPDPQERLGLVRGWTIKPDFASLNVSEEGWLEVGQALLEIGVGLEAGLSSAKGAIRFVKSPLAGRCLRVLLEPEEADPEAAMHSVQAMEKVLGAAKVRTPRLLHGVETTVWPLIEVAFQRGYATRVGFEDTLRLPDGTLAQANAELVLEARKLWSRTR
jgi:uncharacterized protein (DUF849 family)